MRDKRNAPSGGRFRIAAAEGSKPPTSDNIPITYCKILSYSHSEDAQIILDICTLIFYYVAAVTSMEVLES
jgi:hypothetical protein